MEYRLDYAYSYSSAINHQDLEKNNRFALQLAVDDTLSVAATH